MNSQLPIPQIFVKDASLEQVVTLVTTQVMIAMQSELQKRNGQIRGQLKEMRESIILNAVRNDEEVNANRNGNEQALDDEELETEDGKVKIHR